MFPELTLRTHLRQLFHSQFPLGRGRCSTVLFLAMIPLMNRGKFLRYYMQALQKMGRNAFVRHYRFPVLLGIGMYENLSRRRAHGRGTLITEIYSDEERAEPESLVDRVWMVKKENMNSKDEGITVGKTSDNDLVIPEYTLSRKHCEFSLSAEGVFITDLDSLNGTKVNGARIQPHQPHLLQDGAEITLGRFCFELMSPRRFISRVDELSSF